MCHHCGAAEGRQAKPEESDEEVFSRWIFVQNKFSLTVFLSPLMKVTYGRNSRSVHQFY
jgi:hypothetical protein